VGGWWKGRRARQPIALVCDSFSFITFSSDVDESFDDELVNEVAVVDESAGGTVL
jgi:hypothetical protein